MVSGEHVYRALALTWCVLSLNVSSHLDFIFSHTTRHYVYVVSSVTSDRFTFELSVIYDAFVYSAVWAPVARRWVVLLWWLSPT